MILPYASSSSLTYLLFVLLLVLLLRSTFIMVSLLILMSFVMVWGKVMDLSFFAIPSSFTSYGPYMANPFCKDNAVCQFNDWINSFFYPDATKTYFIQTFGATCSHYLMTYLRDLLSGSILYYVTAGLWHLYIYQLKGDFYFKVSLHCGVRGNNKTLYAL